MTAETLNPGATPLVLLALLLLALPLLLTYMNNFVIVELFVSTSCCYQQVQHIFSSLALPIKKSGTRGNIISISMRYDKFYLGIIY